MWLVSLRDLTNISTPTAIKYYICSTRVYVAWQAFDGHLFLLWIITTTTTTTTTTGRLTELPFYFASPSLTQLLNYLTDLKSNLQTWLVLDIKPLFLTMVCIGNDTTSFSLLVVWWLLDEVMQKEMTRNRNPVSCFCHPCSLANCLSASYNVVLTIHFKHPFLVHLKHFLCKMYLVLCSLCVTQ